MYLSFLHGFSHQRSQHLRPPFLVRCGQLSLLSNQIIGLFDHQCPWRALINILDFLYGDNHQRKVASEGLLLLVRCGQLCLLSNQSAGFFDHHHLWRESCDNLGFLDGVSHQGKAASETSVFDWVWSVVLPVQSDYRILRFFDHRYLQKKLSDLSCCCFFCFLFFFAWRQSSREGVLHETTTC